MSDQKTSSQNLVPTLPTVQLGDITRGYLSDYVRLPLASPFNCADEAMMQKQWDSTGNTTGDRPQCSFYDLT